MIANLDLVIAVDTAVAHLAGAMGKPVWTLLPFVPDWRWLLEREDSPWYPTMRLFRQDRIGDWDSVVHRVAQALSPWAETAHRKRDKSTYLSRPKLQIVHLRRGSGGLLAFAVDQFGGHAAPAGGC